MLKHAVIGAVALSATALHAEPFTFVALGDMPYGQPAEVFPAFETLIETVNATQPAFTIHVGDTKSGSTLCDRRPSIFWAANWTHVLPTLGYLPTDAS